MRGPNTRTFLGFLSGFIVACAFSANAQGVQSPMIEGLKKAVENLAGSIVIRGVVVSSEGRPLDNVTLKYFFRQFGDYSAQRQIEFERMQVDGVFQVERQGFSSAYFQFLKIGYYPETWSFVFDENTQRENLGEVVQVDLEIVLRRQPVSAALKRFEGILRTDAQGPVTVVEVERESGRETWVKRNGQKRGIDRLHLVLVAAEGTGSDLPVSEFEDGESHIFAKGLERGWVRLNQLEAGDGFFVLDLDDYPSRPELAFRNMNLAPENGYEPALEVSALNKRNKVFFYCRLNGQYGKGMVSGRPVIAEENGREVARASIVVYLNPTGTRDVAYVHN